MNEQMMTMLVDMLKTGGAEAGKLFVFWRISNIAEQLIMTVLIVSAVVYIARKIILACSQLEKACSWELWAELKKRDRYQDETKELRKKILKEEVHG